MQHTTSEILLGQACSSLSPGEPPLGQVIALNVVYHFILARGECEHSTITPGVNEFIRARHGQPDPHDEALCWKQDHGLRLSIPHDVIS